MPRLPTLAKWGRSAVKVIDNSNTHVYIVDMLNVLSVLIALCALPFTLIGVVPLLGSANYLAIIIALIGLVVGSVATGKAGRNLNILVIVIGIIRLWFGWFIF